MFDIDGKSYQNIVNKKTVDEKKIVDVTAYPVIADGYAYFVGYDGLIYRINKDFVAQIINVIYPDIKGEIFNVSQLIISDTFWNYLIVHAKNKTYFLNSKDTNDLQKSGECKRLSFDKVSFYGKRFYLFMPGSEGQIDFSTTLASYSEEFNLIDGSFNVDDSICDYCIAEFEGAANLVYMKKTKTPRQLKIQRIPLMERSGLPPNSRLSSTDVCDVREFLIYENILVICDHKSNKITLKDWTS
jgi:hypothetical protein